MGLMQEMELPEGNFYLREDCESSTLIRLYAKSANSYFVQ